MDASRRLRRVYYRDAPAGHRQPPLGKAVGASACVPALFPPVTMAELYDDIDVELVDGGVHDNQGIASLLDQDCTVVLVSDASGQMRDAEHPKRGLLGGREPLELDADEPRPRRRRSPSSPAACAPAALRGLMVVHLKKGLPAPPRDWSRLPGAVPSPKTTRSPRDVAAAPRYGIDLDVQRALAELRTDLDAFSDDEAYALMAAGYAMTRVELAQGLGEPPPADPELERQVSWPFAEVLAKLGRPDGESGLGQALRPGRARFFRWLVARRLRRAKPPRGSLGRLLDRTGISALPRLAARGAEVVIVSPLREISARRSHSSADWRRAVADRNRSERPPASEPRRWAARTPVAQGSSSRRAALTGLYRRDSGCFRCAAPDLSAPPH